MRVRSPDFRFQKQTSRIDCDYFISRCRFCVEDKCVSLSSRQDHSCLCIYNVRWMWFFCASGFLSFPLMFEGNFEKRWKIDRVISRFSLICWSIVEFVDVFYNFLYQLFSVHQPFLTALSLKKRKEKKKILAKDSFLFWTYLMFNRINCCYFISFRSFLKSFLFFFFLSVFYFFSFSNRLH